MRSLLALLAFTLSFSADLGLAQTTKDKKSTPKGMKIDSLPGFTKYRIDGFTVLVRDTVLKEQDNPKYKKKPLEALEIELKLVGKVMTKQQAEDLRNNVLVWVEWDVNVASSNGRSGTAVGMYLGVHPHSIVVDDDSYEVNGIWVPQMQYITKLHQKDEKHDSVFLHEFAHAYHDLVLGYDYPDIQAAFQQAMERKKYDKASYLATNEKEFFAELTCAYLDTLDQFPHNRAELKKHDPETFKVLTKVWGPRKDEKIVPKEKPAFDLAGAKLSTLTMGAPLAGPRPTKADLQDRLVLVAFWLPGEPDAPPSLQKMQAWNEELGDYGLVLLSEASWGDSAARPIRNDEDVQEVIQSSTNTLPHFLGGTLAGMEDVTKYPHALLFDATSKCIYRGDVYGAETEMRSALGKLLVDRAGINEFTPAVLPYAEALRKGRPPSEILQKLIEFFRRGQSGDTAAQAKALIRQLKRARSKTTRRRGKNCEN